MALLMAVSMWRSLFIHFPLSRGSQVNKKKLKMLFDLLDRKKNYQYQTVLDVGVNVIRKNDSRMIYGFLF